MPSTSETGHAKNAANFHDLIAFVVGYGATYNPSNAAIAFAALNTKSTAADASLAATNAALADYTNAVNARENHFLDFEPLLTRVVNAAAASSLSPGVMDDIRSIVRKLRGGRAKPAAPDVPDNPATPEDESSTSHSASQMSYDQRVENLDKLIQLLATQPGYAPNEVPLQVVSLQAVLTQLRGDNIALATAVTALSNSRIARDEVLYHETTGLVSLALNVKTYIKSLFGATSPQYAQVSGLKFVRRD